VELIASALLANSILRALSDLFGQAPINVFFVCDFVLVFDFTDRTKLATLIFFQKMCFL
jgi:hypothetical protein